MTAHLGLLARIEAKPEHADDVEQMLTQAVQLARAESGTLTWYAFKLGPALFGVFDTFADEEGREAHLKGRIAAALGEAAPTMLATPPQIDRVDVLAVK
ncbi:putative quinol monooxygenase [Streptacidiphilus jiangxiensis]|uniref:Quinol monooxygenase YgiN n=1 Tax=Streptacidiphilus jiangxiensis TaxID=235985 RepID=A0A1H7W9W3_STRJI|nr:antibiotic biosynthesis monooxygenase [Streptacidiphilus jiangxiensis]SEM18300.1 Quinol monooxygenase YgiN [Streptacidiphilus jiangxiensis]